MDKNATVSTLPISRPMWYLQNFFIVFQACRVHKTSCMKLPKIKSLPDACVFGDLFCALYDTSIQLLST